MIRLSKLCVFSTTKMLWISIIVDISFVNMIFNRIL